jgi:replication factor C subunit 3/5
MIFKEQSPQNLRQIRDKFYNLQVNCIDGSTILKELLEQMMQWSGLQEDIIHQIIHHAAEHEKTLNSGSKSIYHLEAFAAHVMEELIESKSRNYV